MNIPLFKVFIAPTANAKIAEVLKSGFTGQGKVCEEFEKAFHDLTHAQIQPLLMNSCTNALDLAYHLTLKRGDTVISTPQTCFGYNTSVQTKMGGKSIGDLVRDKGDVLVKSYNVTTNNFEYKKVLNFIKLPSHSVEWYRLTLKNARSWTGGNGKIKCGVWVTGDHKVLTNNGYKRVDELSDNDMIATDFRSPNRVQKEIINGLMLGDGSIQQHSMKGGIKKDSYRFTFCQTETKADYVDLIETSLSGMSLSKDYIDQRENSKPYVLLISTSSPYWKEEKQRWYSHKDGRIIPDDLILTPLTMAVWYLDDGSLEVSKDGNKRVILCTDDLSYSEFWKLFYKMVDLGFKPTVGKGNNKKAGHGNRINLNSSNGDAERFLKIVSAYIPPSLRYKTYIDIPFDKSLWDLGTSEILYSSFEATIGTPTKKDRPNSVYCLEVEDNHNFIAQNMVVHNCSATNQPLLHRGCKILWADIDPITGNIDPDSVDYLMNDDVKAIIAVDWGGRPCDYTSLKTYGIPVIQDAAHAIMAEYDGDPIGQSGGDFIAWSFQSIKTLSMADGGALMVPHDHYREAKLLRWFYLDRESKADFRCEQDTQKPGFKYQSNDVLAAIGVENMRHTGKMVAMHRRNARILFEGLSGIPGITVPPFDPGGSYWIFTIICENRAKVQAALAEAGIGCSEVHRRNDLHSCFSEFRRELPGVTYFADHQLNIPCGWWLSESDLQYIIETVKKVK